MSCFKNPRFAKELAYRTMVNYFLLRDYRRSADTYQSSEIEHVLKKMNAEGFDISMKYEITLALNSMLGLLVLPQQEYYAESVNSCSYWQLPILKKCTKEKGYKNSYVSEGFESKDCPALIIKHMRNAVSHDRIMFIPESADNKDITHIRFRDAAFWNGNHLVPFNNKESLDRQINRKKSAKYTVCEFDLHIAADSLEPLIMEIAEYLINFAP